MPKSSTLHTHGLDVSNPCIRRLYMRFCVKGTTCTRVKVLTYKLTVETSIFCRKTITWREREHTAIDNEVMNYQNALDALRGCGLLKFFKMPNMKANMRLLEILIHYWSIEDDTFMID